MPKKLPKKQDVFVTVVLIADSESEAFAKRVKEAATILKKQYANYELLVINNGLIKQEKDSVIKLLPVVPCIRFIDLVKPTDIDTALFAGIEASIGDYVCLVYNTDPLKLIPKFVDKNAHYDVVFGTVKNIKRKSAFESVGAKLFYKYTTRVLGISFPADSTYFISLSRTAVNSLTRLERKARHVRHLARIVGFSSEKIEYELPPGTQYFPRREGGLVVRAIDMVASYSSHPLRFLSYVGLFASVVNIVYAVYVLVVNFARDDIARGWTTLSLQSAVMFFLLFLILAVISEYIGRVLVETRREPAYYIKNEYSSTISVADEMRMNVTK